ncbi:MAG: helix-turn-helix domain-containing protein [Rhodospirillales bacterium]
MSAPGLRLLTALLEQPGALLTKEQLIQRVWGSSVTGDNALHFQMWALRKVLGYDLIVTQSGVGYRFIGQIEGTPPQARREKRPHAPPTNRRQKLAGGEPVPARVAVARGTSAKAPRDC